MLLASEGDEFSQGIGKGLKGCECHLHGNQFTVFSLFEEPHWDKTWHQSVAFFQ